LPRFRIDRDVLDQPVHGPCSVIAANLGDVEAPEKPFRNASSFPNTIDQLSPTSNNARVSASNIADSSWVRVPQTS